MAKGEVADSGGRYAMENISTGVLGGKLHKNLAKVLNEGDSNGWRQLQV